MRINTIEKLEQKIDEELSWRKKELISIKSDVILSEQKNTNEQSRLIRSAISMLYAHWEGAIKSIAEYYLIYVSSLKLEYKFLKNNFLAISIKNSLRDFENSNKATIHNRVIDSIYNKANEVSNIPVDNIIKTGSNLKMEVFEEIAATIGIDATQFSLKKQLIDNRLLGNRNKIAHGEKIERLDGISNVSEYEELHDVVFELIEKFALNIKESASCEKYKI